MNFVHGYTDKMVEEFIKSVNKHYPNMKVILGISDNIIISTKGYANVQLKTFSTS